MPVVPFIPAIIGAGTAIYGAKKSGEAVKGGQEAQIAAADKGIESQERMFERSLELQEPYREAGYSALGGIEGMVTPEGRAEALEGFYASPEYSAMQGQAEQATGRSLGAQGGLRSGTGYEALQSIAPQLGQNYLSNQYNQLTGLANMGMGAASQGAAGAQTLGTNLSNLYGEQGQAAAYGGLAQANIRNQMVGQLGGFAMDAFNQYRSGI